MTTRVRRRKARERVVTVPSELRAYWTAGQAITRARVAALAADDAPRLAILRDERRALRDPRDDAA